MNLLILFSLMNHHVHIPLHLSFIIKLGLKTAAELTETLSAPDFNKLLISSFSFIPPPTVRGIKQLSATLLTILKRVFLPSFVADILYIGVQVDFSNVPVPCMS